MTVLRGRARAFAGSVAALTLAGLSLATGPALAAPPESETGIVLGSDAGPAIAGSGASTVATAGSAPATQRRVDLWATSGTLTGLTTSPGLSPAFDPAVHDYVVRCPQQTGNSIDLTTVGVSLGVPTSSVRLDAGDAVVLHTGAGEYWIRCLPPDFPEMTVNRPGSPSPGYYLAETLYSDTEGTYAYVLDTNGTPVWWHGQVLPLYLTQLAPDTLTWYSWDPGPGSSPLHTMDLKTRHLSTLHVTDRDVDGHETTRSADGNIIWLTTSIEPADLSGIPSAAGGTQMWGCGVEEVDAAGNVLWSWDMADHVDPRESMTTPDLASQLQDGIFDPYHCNSAAEQPGTGNILISARNLNALYLIDRGTGDIIWKMGGSAPTEAGAAHITPDLPFSGQHDARFQPDGDISLFSNNTGTTEPARAQQVRVDVSAGTATTTWRYDRPDGNTALRTGSFRRYASGTDNIVGWGGTPDDGGFDEVDANGNLLMSLRYPNFPINYRVEKLPTTALSLDDLRSSSAGGLGAGPTLSAGETISSPDGRYTLAMQADGNLVLSGPGGVLWSAASNQPGAALTLQSDGNLVLGANDVPIWTANTRTATSLQVTDDGRFVLLDAQDQVVWDNARGGTYLTARGPLTLYPGDQVVSPSWTGRLVMQPDGNLVSYASDGHPTWFTGTTVAGSWAVLQPDGNLVLADAQGQPLWTSATSTGAVLAVTDQGVPTLADAGGGTVWSGGAGYHLGGVSPWGMLLSDGRLVSPDWRYVLAMQTDGNLVLYGPSGALWWSGTNQPGSVLAIQGDGNLVVYSPAGKPLWYSGTRTTGSYLAVQNDGNAVLYSPTGPLWWTGTAGR